MTSALNSLSKTLRELMLSNYTTENCNFTKNWALSPVICKLFIIILLDTCVCVCVCVCVFILFHLLASSDCKTSVTYRKCLEVWNNDLLLWVLLRACTKFLHLRARKCHASPQKTETPDRSKLERKRFDIMCPAKRWYILI